MNAVSSRGIFFVSAAALLGLLTAVQASRATTINFLPIGDSNTWVQVSFTPLVNLLDADGYTANLISNQGKVGYVIDNDYTIGGVYHDDTAREGYALLPIISGTCMNFPNVNSPNTYILLMIGTNDAYDAFDMGDYDVQCRMGWTISEIESLAPLAHLIVAETVPCCSSMARDLAVRSLNVDIAAAVANARVAFPNVSLVDMYPVFQENLYFPYTSTNSPYFNPPSDNIHLDAAGCQLAAQVWYNGIVAVAPSPGLPDGDQGVTAAVPEPSALAMLGAGGMVLAVWLRRGGRPEAAP
jgi:lysophospholipase L1-like esterase